MAFPLKKIAMTHDYETGVWDSIVKYSNSYDANGNLLIDGYETYANGVWTPFSRDVNQYNTNNHVTIQTSQQWDMYLLVWKNMSQNVFNYNPDGTIHYNIYQHWDTEVLAWIDDNREIYTYNAAGKPLTKTTEWLNEATWQPYLKVIYTYNNTNQCTSSQEQTWNVTEAHWSNGYMRFDYIYNDNGSLAQSVLQVWHNNQWENHYRYTYFYDLLAVEQFKNTTGIALYPNPANDIINVSGHHDVADYAISDNMGRIVMTGKLLGNEQRISLTNLATGVYYFKNGKTVSKIIKQ
jgi:hypothetical protein